MQDNVMKREVRLEPKKIVTIYTEPEFDQVNRSIRKFKKESKLEFDTIFKLYKLQNYPLEPRVFKGSSYKYASLMSMRGKVKLATKDTTNIELDKTYNLIRDFIQEIKVCSTPYPYLFNTSGKKVMDLVEGCKLPKEDIAFITSDIVQYSKPASSDEERNVPGFVLQAKRNKEIVDKIEKGEYQMKKKVVKEVRNKIMQKKESSLTKREEKQSIFKTIVSNYTKGFEAIKKALDPNVTMKDSTIRYYMYTCNTWAAGRDVKGKLTSFRKVWEDCNKSKINKSCEPKIESKNISNPISNSDNIRYALIDSNSVLKTSDNLNWLQGYRECYSDKQDKKADLKIFKLIELVEC